MMSSFWGTSLLSGGTTVKPKNMKTLMRAVRSALFLLKHTKTFSHSNFSSANSNRETNESREPSGKTLVGISTYSTPLTNRVFHSTSRSSLNGHLKLSKSESGLSAISSKSINSALVEFKMFKLLLLVLRLLVVVSRSSLDDAIDELEPEEEEALDCFLTAGIDIELESGLINLFKLPTLPLRMPPSESTHSWSSSWLLLLLKSWSAEVVNLLVIALAAWDTSGITLRPCAQSNTQVLGLVIHGAFD